MKNTSLSSSSSFGTIRLMYRLLILLLMDKSGNSLLSESITQLMSHTELPSPPDMQGEDIDVFYRQMAQVFAFHHHAFTHSLSEIIGIRIDSVSNAGMSEANRGR